jgi:hypothetical protein
MAIVIKLELFIPEGFLNLQEGFLIMAADLPKEEFLLCLLILQVP